MKKFIFNNIFLLYITLSQIIICKKHHSKKNKTIHHKESQISSILDWAKINNIYIHPNLVLNKNIDSSHNFYYFTSNSSIPKNTPLLKVPYKMTISKNTLINQFNINKVKKFNNLWEKISSLKNDYLSNYYIKQLLYISIIIEDSINNKKGSLYKKFKTYFDMYEFINIDNFPVFFDEDEIYFLSSSGFGAEIIKATESLNEEYLLTKNVLKFEDSMVDTFLKYRVLTLANSIRFNTTNITNNLNYEEYNDGFNETIVVPFIDCFKKKVYDNNSIMADFGMIKDKEGNYFFEIKSIKDINIGDEISLQWRKLSNQDCYLYYGFIDEENKLLPSMYVNVLNNMMKNDLNIDESINFTNIAKRDLYDLTKEFIESDVVYSYKNISEYIDKYKNKKEGRYEMMSDNLNYYLSIYETQITEGNINIYIRGNEKKRIIKLLMKTEQEIFIDRINYVNMLIEDIKSKKYNLDGL